MLEDRSVVLLPAAQYAFADGCLDSGGDGRPGHMRPWCHQEVDVLRHDDPCHQEKVTFLVHATTGVHKDITESRCAEELETAITGERQKPR